MINTSILMGRLTTDPELRTTTSGIETCRFTVAIERSFQKAGEERRTDFINVLAWRQTARFVSSYFRKGSMIAIEGSIQTGSYTDKEGNKKYKFEVVANNVSFCGSKNESQPANNNFSQPNEPASSYSIGSNSDFDEIVTDDDLPF